MFSPAVTKTSSRHATLCKYQNNLENCIPAQVVVPMKRSQYKWTLPKEISARLGQESWGAQRAIFEAGHLLLVLHAPPKNGGNEREHEVFLWQPDGTWKYKGHDRGEYSLARLLDDYASLLSELENRYQKAVDIDALFAIIDRLIPLVRASANMQLALQSAREALGNNDTLIIDMRDRAVAVARGLELLLADSRLALDFRMARSAEAQTRVAEATMRAQNKLNSLAALAFPLMTISAVFGMSLPSGLERFHVLAFWLVLVGGVFLGWWVKGWISATPPKDSTETRSVSKAKR